jgi:two-component system, cell cycle sensor histidine kinase and response regulator CckA
MLPDRQLKILVVEDNVTDREIHKQCLRTLNNRGIEFAEAASAAAGIELAGKLHPDCILLDYELPDRNGLEVMAHWNQLGEPGAVVMLTAFGGEELAVQAMKAGAADYLPKRQVSPETLSYAVANAIQKFEMQRRIDQYRVVLERSERRYEALLECMPQMVWVADASGAIQYTNRRWIEYTGLTIENAGRLGWDRVLHSDDRERSWEAWRAATESGVIFEIEHRLRRAADQSYRWQLVRAVPVKSRDGEITNWFGTCTDVDDQKQAEKAVLEKEKLEGLGLLASGIAHDFNNLLTNITCGASLVMDTLPAAHSARPVVDEMIAAGERGAELTRKMLAYSGRGKVIVGDLDLYWMARETCDFLRGSLPANMTLEVHAGGSLPLVRSDTGQLRQIIVELVRNAAEAIGETEPGRISVRISGAAPELVRQAKLESAIPFVILEVEDTGCGMDAATQVKMFDPFFSTKFTGRGLGLAAVQGFVRSHGGAIVVSSSPGAGAIFRVLLPAASDKSRPTAACQE